MEIMEGLKVGSLPSWSKTGLGLLMIKCENDKNVDDDVAHDDDKNVDDDDAQDDDKNVDDDVAQVEEEDCSGGGGEGGSAGEDCAETETVCDTVETEECYTK